MTGLPDIDLLPDEDRTSFGGRLVFVQSTGGWRFGVDAVLLARHLLAGPQGPLLEVGTGCGIVAVLVVDGGWQGPVTAVEVQPALADRARRNVQANGMDGRIRVVQGDVRGPGVLPDGGTWARIASNPPFYRLGTGRPNPDPERAAARHEVLLDLRGLLDIVRDRLAPDGLATVLYPAFRMEEVTRAASDRGLGVTGITPAVPSPGARPEVFLLDIARGTGRLATLHPEVTMTGSIPIAAGEAHGPDRRRTLASPRHPRGGGSHRPPGRP